MKSYRLFNQVALLLVAFVFVGLVSGSLFAEQKAPMELPDGMSVYDAPDPLPPGKHGDLIWFTEIKTEIPNASAWKLLYRSTDIHDVDIPVSGIVITQIGVPPSAGRPVVSYAHGTVGLARSCAPSKVNNPAKDLSLYSFPSSSDPIDSGIPALTQMIAAGYVVAVTDYVGLGGPGIHQYVIGPTEARNVLDIAVAAQQIPQAGAGKQAVVIGWSQGGQAAVWSAQLADYVTDAITILGSAALAPANPAEQLKIEQKLISSGKQLPATSQAQTVMAFYALAHTFSDLRLKDVLTPFGIEFVRESGVNQCVKHMGQSLTYMQSWKGPVLRSDPEDQEAWMNRIGEMSLGNVPAQVPVAVYQGDDDTTIFPAATEAYVNKACASGSTISYNHYAGTDHYRIPAKAQDDFLRWIADRFAGKPAKSNCN